MTEPAFAKPTARQAIEEIPFDFAQDRPARLRARLRRGRRLILKFDRAYERRHPLVVSAQEIIEQIKGLPASERAQVVKFLMENDDSWIPESFKKGMSDAAAGRFANIENVLSGAEPPPRAAE